MISIKNSRCWPAALPLFSDNITEFHASRLLLLIYICGINGNIEGLTKLAKLDFFVRYPIYFARISSTVNYPISITNNKVESSMIRYHYGPWDKRYYQVLAYLESRKIIEITKKNKKTFTFSLTDLGKHLAQQFLKQDSFSDLCNQMQQVKKTIGNKSGNTLKNIIYNLFKEEVTNKPLGEVIK